MVIPLKYILICVIKTIYSIHTFFELNWKEYLLWKLNGFWEEEEEEEEEEHAICDDTGVKLNELGGNVLLVNILRPNKGLLRANAFSATNNIFS